MRWSCQRWGELMVQDAQSKSSAKENPPTGLELQSQITFCMFIRFPEPMVYVMNSPRNQSYIQLRRCDRDD